LPASGVNEIHPAGTGLPRNETVPEIWAICGPDEGQPAARTSTAAPPTSRRTRPRIGDTPGRRTGYQSPPTTSPFEGVPTACQVRALTLDVTVRTLPSA